jgi:hypothetical protein
MDVSDLVSCVTHSVVSMTSFGEWLAYHDKISTSS